MFKLCFVRTLSREAKNVETKQSKAKVIRDLNFENKSLFGEVIKQRKKTVVNVKPSATQPESELASEIFWQFKTSTHLRTRKESARWDSEDNAKSVQPRAATPPLPFSFDELKAMTRFPLVPTNNGFVERTWSRHEQYESTAYRSPSVSTILSATMPESARQALMRWKATKIAELGVDGFAALQQETMARGADLHRALELWMNEEMPSDEQLGKTGKLWDSIQDAVLRVQRPAEIIERKIYHPYLHYTGVVDCVARIKKQCHIIEWKTSEKPKTTLAATYDAPLQLCAYLGALQADPSMAELRIDGGAVFVAYTNGNPADVHVITEKTFRKYWTAWLHRVQEYWIRYRDGTLPDPI